mgnify:CR=1 FL=1
MTGDLSAGPSLTDGLRGVNAVVHLAGRAHVMHDTAVDPERAFHEANVAATRHLARQAAAAGVRRFVFVSSIKVNGERTARRPFTELDEAAPEDAYARSKWAAELALQEIAAGTGMEIAIVRPPLVYGPGVRANFLRLMRLVERGVPLPLSGVRNRRSLVSVWNLCDLLSLCARHPAAAGETFLVSDREDLSTPELVHALADGLGRRARLFPFPVAALRAAAGLLGRAEMLDRLVDSLQVDCDKAAGLLDWRPCVPVREGLRRTAAWYRSEAPPAGMTE